MIAQGAFALAYAHSAMRGWVKALAAAIAAFAVAWLTIRALSPVALTVAMIAWLFLALVLRLLPPRVMSAVTAPPPAWDLPARMVVATVLVLALTASAPALGPFTSGVLSGFPLYATVLAVFGQRAIGPSAAIAVMRGLTAGLFASTAFFLVIATMLPSLGTAGAFGLAIAVILAVQGVSFSLLRRAG